MEKITTSELIKKKLKSLAEQKQHIDGIINSTVQTILFQQGIDLTDKRIILDDNYDIIIE